MACSDRIWITVKFVLLVFIIVSLVTWVPSLVDAVNVHKDATAPEVSENAELLEQQGRSLRGAAVKPEYVDTIADKGNTAFMAGTIAPAAIMGIGACVANHYDTNNAKFKTNMTILVVMFLIIGTALGFGLKGFQGDWQERQLFFVQYTQTVMYILFIVMAATCFVGSIAIGCAFDGAAKRTEAEELNNKIKNLEAKIEDLQDSTSGSVETKEWKEIFEMEAKIKEHQQAIHEINEELRRHGLEIVKTDARIRIEEYSASVDTSKCGQIYFRKPSPMDFSQSYSSDESGIPKLTVKQMEDLAWVNANRVRRRLKTRTQYKTSSTCNA